MATLFTRIIDGEIPGTFVWEDDRCVAFLSINPLTPGHTLVVPREEVDHWIDLPDDLAQHLMSVARTIGRAQQQAFVSERVAVIIAGYEIPHTHLHVFPTTHMGQLNFANAAASVSGEELDDAAGRIRSALAGGGRGAAVASRSMGEMVEFASNGNTASGYLVRPARGGPGVLVIQEWWGLDSSLEEVTDRLGSAGFVALAPDLYHGELAGHDEMDKAAQLMQSMPPDRAARDMSGAVDFLAGHEAVHGNGIGVVGFCMGGMLAWLIAANRPDQVRAIVPFYGFPQGDMEPDWSSFEARARAHLAENDDFFPPDAGNALGAKLQAMGKDVTVTVHPGTGHAFMAPHNALGTRDEAKAEEIWPQVIDFLHEAL